MDHIVVHSEESGEQQEIQKLLEEQVALKTHFFQISLDGAFTKMVL